MPYDKVIDSAKLDGALSATADAIRAATGGTAKIAWDASNGFASAIGSMAKAVSGSFVGSGQNLATDPVTISGLGFKPSRVIVYVSYLGSASIQYGDFLASADSDESVNGAIVSIGTDYNDNTYSFVNASTVTFTMNEDGFTLGASGYTTLRSGYGYQYVALS